MARLLLTWSDRGALGKVPAHQALRSDTDVGPVLRLLSQIDRQDAYDRVWVLTTEDGEVPARELAAEIERFSNQVEVLALDVRDPSDHARLFDQMKGVVERFRRERLSSDVQADVLLSAGTPQVQTLWVILVESGLLDARMLQVIPAAFVPDPHPRAVREVKLDIEGFPEIRALRDEVARLRAQVKLSSFQLVGESDPIRRLKSSLTRIAAADVPVLILGETGTGKEMVARAIHEGSARAKGPFVAENCGAFAEGVLASELFGHESGAFTGATRKRRGLFEQAHSGTLFLDEVGDMEPRVQAHLLRVLQEGTLRRVGGEAPIRTDVRLIAATNRDPKALVRAGTFREDLYYRLRGISLTIPPLRERREDIPLLVRHFMDEMKSAGRLRVTPAAMDALQGYPWPGNVRELRAEVYRWPVFCEDVVDVADLSSEVTRADSEAYRPEGQPGASPEILPLAKVVAAAERSAVRHALQEHRGNISRTAASLRIDRNTLKRKLKQYGLR